MTRTTFTRFMLCTALCTGLLGAASQSTKATDDGGSGVQRPRFGSLIRP